MSLTAPRPPETISIKETAERLNMHENTVRNWVDRQLLAAYRTPTGRRKVLLSEVERLQREMYGAPRQPLELHRSTPVPPQAGQFAQPQL